MRKLQTRQLKDNTNIDIIKKSSANSNSKSKHRGVHWNSYHKKWVAVINFQCKPHFCGYFDNIEDAIKARKAAEDKYFKPILKKYKEQN